ncbi:MAG TPA: biopolymer transporter ExbD [Gemmatimonadales bacterium]|jgi:biopolymer transport protein ExbD|nr:biopolymer transporter ExbD [Gemmatimonadales bacterium]
MLPRAEISVTPMMDVMLVLLMIFMFIVPAIDAAVRLPTAAHADPNPAEGDDIVLRIDATGRYSLDSPDATPRGVTQDELGRVLGNLYNGRTKDRVLYLKADRELRFGAVQHAIEIARASGVRVVATIVERQRD